MHNPLDVEINSSSKICRTHYLFDDFQGFCFSFLKNPRKSENLSAAKKPKSVSRLNEDGKTEIVNQEWRHQMGILMLFLSPRYFPSHRHQQMIRACKGTPPPSTPGDVMYEQQN